jgi:phenylpropionate dioxygenase-like ring-hydroxylating dioxygenase large terminal subunit
MLSKEENDSVTKTGPGTPMGELMRSYWIPVALSGELPEADSPPIRVKLLGERLVAFRDSAGRVGLLEEFCAHRRASLFLGRNEEGGLRCVYHGWKYDASGKCLEMPNEPPESRFCDKIRLKSYSTVEQGGVIWAYLGPESKKPPSPNLEWTQLPESHRSISKTWQECNWLQALEGGIDSSHSSFLHRALSNASAEIGIVGYRVSATCPKSEVEVTDYGLAYASIRPLDEQKSFVRVYHFVMPFHTFFARQVGQRGEVFRLEGSGHIFVPMDDTNTMVYNLVYSFGEQPLDDKEAIEIRRGRGPGTQTADFRKVRNKDNDWLIDRSAQKHRTFTGIQGINTQDHAIQESMGPVVDRTQEHLGTSDLAIIKMRRVLLDSIKANQAGSVPPGMGSKYPRIRPVERILSNDVPWREEMKPHMYPQ